MPLLQDLLGRGIDDYCGVMQEQQSSQVCEGEDAMPTPENASLQDDQGVQEQQSTGASFLPPADAKRHEPSGIAATRAGGHDVHSQSAPNPATAADETATAVYSSSPVVLKPIMTGKSESSEVEQGGMGSSAMDPGHLAAGGRGLAESGRANSMQSSPIFGVASAGSQAFTPTQNRAGHSLRQGAYRIEIDLAVC